MKGEREERGLGFKGDWEGRDNLFFDCRGEGHDKERGLSGLGES